MWGTASERIGVLTFNLDGLPPGLLAAVLSPEHGIGVRHGCFCAHPLMVHLLRVNTSSVRAIRAQLDAGRQPLMPGAVRASMGVTTSTDGVDRLLTALAGIAEHGPCWRYVTVGTTGDYVPDPDPRPRPALPAVFCGAVN